MKSHGWQIRTSKTKEHLVKDQHQTCRGTDASRKDEASRPQIVEEAKRDGRWDGAYSPPSTAKLPHDFTKALQKNKKAQAFFETLNRANIYSIVFRLETARTREQRRMKVKHLVRMLEKGKKFH